MLSDTIERLRIEKGLTQTELGELIGVKKAAVQKYESGLVKNLKQNTIQKLADVFGMSTGMFITLCNEEQIKNEANLIGELKMLYGKEAVEILVIFTELNSYNKKKVLDYSYDMLKIQGV